MVYIRINQEKWKDRCVCKYDKYYMNMISVYIYRYTYIYIYIIFMHTHSIQESSSTILFFSLGPPFKPPFPGRLASSQWLMPCVAPNASASRWCWRHQKAAEVKAFENPVRRSGIWCGWNQGFQGLIHWEFFLYIYTCSLILIHVPSLFLYHNLCSERYVHHDYITYHIYIV